MGVFDPDLWRIRRPARGRPSHNLWSTHAHTVLRWKWRAGFWDQRLKCLRHVATGWKTFHYSKPSHVAANLLHDSSWHWLVQPAVPSDHPGRTEYLCTRTHIAKFVWDAFCSIKPKIKMKFRVMRIQWNCHWLTTGPKRNLANASHNENTFRWLF